MVIRYHFSRKHIYQIIQNRSDMDKETVDSHYLSGGEDSERLYSIAMYLL